MILNFGSLCSKEDVDQIVFEEANDVKVKQEMKMEIDASRCQLDDCLFHSGLNLLNLNYKGIEMCNIRHTFLILSNYLLLTSKLEN